MKTNPPTSDQKPHPPGATGVRLRSPVLSVPDNSRAKTLAAQSCRQWNPAIIFGFSTTLFTLTCLHATKLDAFWPTENALLVFFTVMLASWCIRLQVVLIMASIAAFSWWLIEVQQDPDLLSCSLRHLMRVIPVLLLVMLSRKARRMLDEAQGAALIDVLTGLPNRRAILQTLEAELSRLRRFKRSLSVAMIDCDGFKLINDQRGHLAGDRVLQTIASAFRHQLRAYDSIGRLGGDEFVLILPETSFDEVSSIVERLRTALRMDLSQESPSLSFSIGVVTVEASSDPDASTPDCDTCLNQADQAMYAAKRSGRDQTRCEKAHVPEAISKSS